MTQRKGLANLVVADTDSVMRALGDRMKRFRGKGAELEEVLNFATGNGFLRSEVYDRAHKVAGTPEGERGGVLVVYKQGDDYRVGRLVQREVTSTGQKKGKWHTPGKEERTEVRFRQYESPLVDVLDRYNASHSNPVVLCDESLEREPFMHTRVAETYPLCKTPGKKATRGRTTRRKIRA